MSDRLAHPRFSRRSFIGSAAGAAALTAVSGHLRTQQAWAAALSAAKPAVAASTPESLVKVLYDTFTEPQRKAVCFAWNYQHPKMGLLRTRVENNWNITSQHIESAFYTPEQRDLMRKIYEGMLNPDWVSKVDRQLKDDAGGWGKNQAVAMFGTPGGDKFEMVMTGRHLTLRCDGNTAEHVAFGGPIFHGHAAGGFHEKPGHPNNIFWPQALEANKIYTMLDGKQRDLALVKKEMPEEEEVAFKGAGGKFQGIPLTELSADQKGQVQKVLSMLIEPYRQSDADEAVACLKKQGGLDACHLAFYEEGDLGKDGVYDNWRLEGPSFVWHFRGKPHVHIWINVADDAGVKLNTFSSAAGV
jgi:hypothetical protein